MYMLQWGSKVCLWLYIERHSFHSVMNGWCSYSLVLGYLISPANGEDGEKVTWSDVYKSQKMVLR